MVMVVCKFSISCYSFFCVISLLEDHDDLIVMNAHWGN